MRRRKGFRGGVHFASYRRLGVESLETRRLLAGDSLSLSQHPIDDSSAIESVAQQIQDLAVNFTASDAAGDTMRTAADLGVVDGTLQRAGRLSWFDRIDVVRFEVASDAKVRITLDQLNRDADLYVLDRNGNLIGSSKRSSNRSESLSGSLPGGEYYLAISSVDYRSISYRLTLDVQTSQSPAVATPPAAPTPEPQQPAPPEPSTVTPLADVAYFGGSQDWNINAVAAPEAWAAGYRGQGVTVAVIDTGVDLDHPDLAHNLYINPGEIPGNGIDDDRNGYVDDITGYDFVSGDAVPDDGNGHGTHVAGTIAAGDNGFGVTGVAPDAKILPVRVLDDSGSGSDAGVAAGIRYAADLGAQIINLSLGGGVSSRIASAIDYATSLGSLVIAAAGNESAASPSYPARHSAESTSVLSVGAYDSSGRVAGFSNEVGGSGAVQVDAPGVSVVSTYAGGGYRSLSGTSMASPHVAGVAALTLSANPQLTSAELRELLASGTVGQATSSDSIGKVSTLNSVAFAAAGLTSAGDVTDSQIATSATSSTDVRTKTGDGVPAPSDFLPQRPAVAAEERLEGDIDSLPAEVSGIKQVASAEPLSSQAVDHALAHVDVDWTDAVQRQHDADSFIELPGDLDAAGSGFSLRGSAS
ncbi:Subtilisin DY [Stieleria neptunia]|uniref:Subtilisin DY n=1 Tax=Stieleria neptunia TaxID=2527979 RepID=A0A518HKX2_9BACT|nr:S8 family serine peptidase [Stieleria neptunia]QDV41495.1 Subtilisin DY [Stieleria neptunia]